MSDRSSVNYLTQPVAQLRVTLMSGNWAEQHWERDESVDGSDCPTLLVEYRFSSRHLQ